MSLQLPGSKRWLVVILFVAVGAGTWWWSMSTQAPVTTTVTNIVANRAPYVRTLVDPKDASVQVPVLMYHYIRTCDDPEDENCPALSVSRQTFTSQMQWMHDHGYEAVDMEYFPYPYKIDGQPFVVTFDDGYADTYTDALPVLERFGFTATWYIITDRIGKESYLSWDQVRDLVRRGMIVGSHTMSHPDLTSISGSAITGEVQGSKEKLIQELSTDIDAFCYPYGRYGTSTVNAVRAAGYLTATTTVEGVARRDMDFLTLPRIRMKETTNLEKALARTSPVNSNVNY